MLAAAKRPPAMTQAEMKLSLFRIIDRLSAAKLKVVYQTLSHLLGETPGPEAPMPPPSHIEPAHFQAGEKPSDFAGIWEGPLRDLQEIRARAWQRDPM